MRADAVYPLYGLRWWAYESLRRLSNSTVYNYAFGDSSYIVPYLKAVGLDLGKNVQQSGSNFGVSHKWHTPFLSHVGRGTLISDGLQFVNVGFSSSSFVLQHASIGAQNFVGNSIVLPAQSRVGDNCLLATKVMVPTGGEMRENVGLLGSPAFEIPTIGQARRALRPIQNWCRVQAATCGQESVQPGDDRLVPRVPLGVLLRVDPDPDLDRELARHV
jgi:non-ribosomal peptide synthetase-like protein